MRYSHDIDDGGMKMNMDLDLELDVGRVDVRGRGMWSADGRGLTER